MIFYGTKGSHLKTIRSKAIKCDNCNEIAPHNVSIFGKYGYLYWIPVFPMGKKAFSECNNCKVTSDFKGMNEQLRHASADVKRDTKTPIWYWSGLGVIAILIAVLYYFSLQHDEDVQTYLIEPAVGDIIEFKNTDTNYYSTLKITSITKDSIFVIQNNYETDKMSGVSKIDKASNYTTAPFGIGREDYPKMFEEGILYDINR